MKTLFYFIIAGAVLGAMGGGSEGVSAGIGSAIGLWLLIKLINLFKRNEKKIIDQLKPDDDEF